MDLQCCLVSGRTLTIRADPFWDVQDVKDIISTYLGYAQSNIILIHGTEVIANEVLLSNLGSGHSPLQLTVMQQSLDEDYSGECERIPPSEQRQDPVFGAQVTKIVDGVYVSGHVQDMCKYNMETWYEVAFQDGSEEWYTSKGLQTLHTFVELAAGKGQKTDFVQNQISNRAKAARAELQQRFAAVRTGGKGTVRRKKIRKHVSFVVHEKQLHASLKKAGLNIYPLPDISEVRMFEADGSSIQILEAQVHVNSFANMYCITGHAKCEVAEDSSPSVTAWK